MALMTLSVKALKSIDMAWMVAEFARDSRRVSALSRRLLRLIVEDLSRTPATPGRVAPKKA